MSTLTMKAVTPHLTHFHPDNSHFTICICYFSLFLLSSCVGWCQRIKSEFKFEYAYLENELSQTTGGSAGSGAPAGGNQSGSQTSQN